MRKILCLLAGATLLLAACGDDGATKTSTGDAPVQLSGQVNNKGQGDASSGTVTVTMEDFAFNPTYIKIKPDSEVTIKLTNTGKQAHTFTIESLNVDKTVDPGKSDEVKFKTEASGAVEFVCTFHVGSGMKGALFVNSGDKLSGAGGAGSGETTTTKKSGGGYGY
jgi:plastocyanin